MAYIMEDAYRYLMLNLKSENDRHLKGIIMMFKTATCRIAVNAA